MNSAVVGDQFYVETFDGERSIQRQHYDLDRSVQRQHYDLERSINHPVDDIPEPDAIEETIGLYKYDALWIEVGQVKSTWFMVKSCSEAHVIVTRYFAVADFYSYEIRIGAYVFYTFSICDRVYVQD